LPDVPWFDHHCHLDIEGAATALAAAREAGVERLVCVGTDRSTTDAAVAVAAAHPGTVWATAGCHPHEARHGWDWLDDAIRLPGVIAVGEAGLGRRRWTSSTPAAFPAARSSTASPEASTRPTPAFAVGHISVSAA
jgi:Tat protein secretion system quality control protein TatD with DNase activity